MTTLIMDCFGLAPVRLKLMYEFFSQRDDRVQIISSDWDHFKKKQRASDLPHVVYLPTLPYYKNISVRRLVSHWLFARSAFFFFNDPATTEIYTIAYTLSLHDALPI